MGVVNVTPDSFSDGGVNFRAEDAIASARRMRRRGRGDRRRRRRVDAARLGRRVARRGAAPGHARCSRRLAGVPVSIDTAKAEVARRAIELGAELVNDVTALRGDPELAGVVADAGAYLCLMHMRGEPRTMQDEPALRRRRSRGGGVPRGAARLRGRAGHLGGANLPRPGHRLRQDRRAQRRARPQARRAARARPAGGDRLLAQALARPDARRPGRDDRLGLPRASARPSPPTSAARRSCGCTTSARPSRRSRSRRRCCDRRAARAGDLRPPRRARGGEARRPDLRLRRRARGRGARVRPDRGCGRLSTRARTACRRCPIRARST